MGKIAYLQTQTEFFSAETRMDAGELYKMMIAITQKALLSNNRCALISGIASMLSNIRGDDEEIKGFIRLQIDRDIDCGPCTRCEAGLAKSDA
jgi:hypothetical protein